MITTVKLSARPLGMRHGASATHPVTLRVREDGAHRRYHSWCLNHPIALSFRFNKRSAHRRLPTELERPTNTTFDNRPTGPSTDSVGKALGHMVRLPLPSTTAPTRRPRQPIRSIADLTLGRFIISLHKNPLS